MKESSPVLVKVYLSTVGTGLGGFSALAERKGTYRKDYIRDGDWQINDLNEPVLKITPERRKKWDKNFQLMRERGYSVPLTINHGKVLDPETKLMVEKSFSSDMAEAKLGDITNLFGVGDRGMFDAIPADVEAERIMARCPEVSLELQRNWTDVFGNFYDEAITAITITSKPAIPGQFAFEKIAASRQGGTLLCLSADPLLRQKENSQENSTMEKPLLDRAKVAMKMSHDTPDEVVHHKLVDHMEKCSSASYLSMQADVARLTTELAEAKAHKPTDKINLDRTNYDEDGLEGKASGATVRINALSKDGKINLAQTALLKDKFCGVPGLRPLICLSRKASVMVGLEEPLVDTVLSLLEAGDVLAPKQKSGSQDKTKLDRSTDNGEEPEKPALAEMPDLIKDMAGKINGRTEAPSLVM